jgi:LysR family transcriptional regulator, glycine cleavage system transcriptional activator
MRIRSPSLPELHAFVAVVETGGFSRAASRLSVTQGAVSRSVLRLEARLGIALLERSPSGVRATEAGKSYYARVQPAVTALEAAVPAGAQESQRRLLRVSAIPTLGMRWLVPRLPSFYAAHPEVQILFQPYRREDDLLRDDVDCWLVARPSASSRWPRHVRATYIVGREIVPICHPSVAGRIRAPGDVLRFPLLHHSGFPQNWALWCQAQRVDTRAIKLAAGFDLAAGLIEAVVANMGIAVVQRCLIEREIAEGKLVVPLPLAVSTGRGYYLCVPRAREDAGMPVDFRAWLLAQSAAGTLRG